MTQVSERLRPLGIRDILDQTVRIYRRSFLTLVGVVALALVPFLVLQFGILTLGLHGLDTLGALAAGAQPLTPALALDLILTVLIGLLSAYVFSTIVPAALAKTAAGAILGSPIGVWQSYRVGWRNLWSLSWAAGLVGVFFLALLFLLFTCIGLPVALPAMTFFGTRWAFVVQTSTLENARTLTSLERSWRLVNTQFWRSCAFLSLLVIFTSIAMVVPLLGLSLGLALLPSLPAAVSTAVRSLSTALMVMVGLPVLIVGITAQYFDLRVRREGLDLELALRELEESLPEKSGVDRRMADARAGL